MLAYISRLMLTCITVDADIHHDSLLQEAAESWGEVIQIVLGPAWRDKAQVQPHTLHDSNLTPCVISDVPKESCKILLEHRWTHRLACTETFLSSIFAASRERFQFSSEFVTRFTGEVPVKTQTLPCVRHIPCTVEGYLAYKKPPPP